MPVRSPPAVSGERTGIVNLALVALLARSSAHFFRRHPAQLALSLLGIVLGVGIVTAVLITNASAQRAFALSSEALYGRTTHQVLGASGVDGRDYAALRRALPTLRMAPVVEGQVAIEGEIHTLIGLDPFAESGFGRGTGALSMTAATTGQEAAALDEDGIAAALRLLLDDDALAISETTRARLDLPLDVPLDVETGERTRALRLVGSFTSDNPAASEGLLLADIALAQRVLGLGGRISRIDMILDEREHARVEALLPATLRLGEAASREQTMRAMTRGFQINLTAMSLLALVVGAFLIHNTMTFAVLQRRELFATLRITGITSRALLASVLAEALAIGAAGSALGIALGWGLAHALIRLTTRTINDLYFVLHVQTVAFDVPLAIAGLALGIGASVLAAAVSALDAAAISPAQASRRSLTESRTRALLPAFARVGLAAITAGALLALAPLESLLAGFVALMLLILGYGLVLPWAVRVLSGALVPLARRLGTVWALAAGGIERNISRTGLAVAALAIAVSATFGVEIMITSFRASVDEWLDTTLGSDIYLSAPSTVSSQASTPLHASVPAIAAGTPGVAHVSSGRVVKVASDVGRIDMLVLEPHVESAAGFEFLAGEPVAGWQALLDEDSVLVSEPLSTRHGVGVGDRLTLFTGVAGEHAFRIVGVVRDYGSSHGRLTMSRATWSRWWRDTRVSSLGLLLDADSDAERVLDTLRERLAPIEQPLLVRSNETIHRQSLAVFDRTFEVTRVLRWLTVGVAFVGIFSALLALHLERAREFAVLRATGATRTQVAASVTAQTLLMGALAGLLSLPLGWGMAEILIHIINVRSFGWSMQSHLPAGAALSALALACLSAVLAGVWPAWRLARANVAEQLRND